MEKEDIEFLKQLIETLEESSLKLEESFTQKDYAKFNKLKQIMYQIQIRIAAILR